MEDSVCLPEVHLSIANHFQKILVLSLESQVKSEGERWKINFTGAEKCSEHFPRFVSNVISVITSILRVRQPH